MHHNDDIFKPQLVFLQHPATSHRARYKTEGSRGPIKDRSGKSFPLIKLLNYYQPAKLICYIGDEKGEPSILYKVTRITGKNCTPCNLRKIGHFRVCEFLLTPENNMEVLINCIGILKERLFDVQKLRNAATLSRSHYCRLVFSVNLNYHMTSCIRPFLYLPQSHNHTILQNNIYMKNLLVQINNDSRKNITNDTNNYRTYDDINNGNQSHNYDHNNDNNYVNNINLTNVKYNNYNYNNDNHYDDFINEPVNDHTELYNINIISDPILCIQTSGSPEILKISSNSGKSGDELFIIGRNFGKDSVVIFEKDYLRTAIVPEKEFSGNGHLVCVLPQFGFIGTVDIRILSDNKKSQTVSFNVLG